MKFSEKLQKLRKENNLSQEQLADKLDVSRQSVSKWESGQTYPEMDKLLTMCKLFNITLDDLTNDEINISDVKPKNKNTFDNLVDDVMYIIDKTYLMFTNMEPKERGKCIGELIIILIILLLFRIPFEYVISIGDSLLYYLPANYVFMNLWTFIINIVYLILFVFTYLYIYKTYFLDKYKEKEKPKEETPQNTKEEKETIEGQKEIKEEKIVKIKEKKHRTHTFGTTLYEILGFIVNFCFKGFLIFISVPFIISFVFIIMAFFFLLILITKGIFFVGFLICAAAAIILNWILLKLIFSFLFNYKPKFNFMFLPFIIGLTLIGLGTVISIYDVLSIDYINEAPKVEFEKQNKEYIYEYKDNLVFTHTNPNDYVIDETLGNNIKVNTEYYKELNYVEYVSFKENKYNTIDFWYYNRFNKSMYNLIIDNLKDKKLYNYGLLEKNKITITATSETINKLKSNYDDYINYLDSKQYDREINYYENEIGRLENQNADLLNQIDNLNEKIYNYEEENQNLKNKIQEYKDNLENILGN